MDSVISIQATKIELQTQRVGELYFLLYPVTAEKSVWVKSLGI